MEECDTEESSVCHSCLQKILITTSADVFSELFLFSIFFRKFWQEILQKLMQTYGVGKISRLLKIWVSFAKEPYKRDYILQKRPMILRSLLKTREFQTQLLHYFSKSDNKSNHHQS